VRHTWSNDTESYAGRSVATGRIFRVRQIEGDDPEGDSMAHAHCMLDT